MKLSEIIQVCDVLSVQGNPDVEITGVNNDSRRVGPGSLFIAVNGCGNDGRAYIGKAIEAGAAAVMFEDFEDDSAGRSAGLPDGRTEIISQTGLPENPFPLRFPPAGRVQQGLFAKMIFFMLLCRT